MNENFNQVEAICKIFIFLSNIIAMGSGGFILFLLQ